MLWAIASTRRGTQRMQLVLTTVVACLAGGALLLTWSHVNWMRLFNVSHSVPPHEVSDTVAVAIALVLLGLPASLCSRIFAGYQEVHLSNLAVAAGTVANVAGLFAGIALKASMPVLLVMSSGGVTLANLGRPGRPALLAQAVAAAEILARKLACHPRVARLRGWLLPDTDCRGSGFQL